MQDGWGRLETVIFEEIRREFSGMDKLSDLPTITQRGNQGEKPSPLTPLIFSHFTYWPVPRSDLSLPAAFHVPQQELPIFLS